MIVIKIAKIHVFLFKISVVKPKSFMFQLFTRLTNKYPIINPGTVFTIVTTNNISIEYKRCRDSYTSWIL